MDGSGLDPYQRHKEETMKVPNLIDSIPKCISCPGLEAQRPLVGLFKQNDGWCIQLWCPTHGSLLVAKLGSPIEGPRVEADDWDDWRA